MSAHTYTYIYKRCIRKNGAESLWQRLSRAFAGQFKNWKLCGGGRWQNMSKIWIKCTQNINKIWGFGDFEQRKRKNVVKPVGAKVSEKAQKYARKHPKK